MKSAIFCKFNYFLLLLSFSFSANSYSEEIDIASSQQCIKASMFCDSLTVRGEFYKVIEAVYQQDFKDELSKKTKMNDIQDKDPRHFLDLTKIENYDFGIDSDKEKNIYHVSVGPKMRINGPVFFGSTNYELDMKTLKILKKYKEK